MHLLTILQYTVHSWHQRPTVPLVLGVANAFLKVFSWYLRSAYDYGTYLWPSSLVLGGGAGALASPVNPPLTWDIYCIYIYI